MAGLQQTYLDRAATFRQEAERLKKQYLQWSLLRLLLFILGVGLIIYLWTTFGWMIGAATLVVSLLLFGAFMRRHQNLQEAQLHQERLADINTLEAAVCSGDYQSFNNGARFSDPLHAYGVDLDLFGPYSIFQYLNRTTTSYGEASLAQMLSKSPQKEVLLARQRAVEELKPQLEWRQNLQALGMVIPDEQTHLKALRIWLTEPPILLGHRLWIVLMYLAPALGLAGLILGFLKFPALWPLLFWAPAALALRQTVHRINETHRRTAQAQKILENYARMIAWVESGQFRSGTLLNLQQLFKGEHRHASQALQRLAYIISQLNVRFNFFAVFLNLWGLWDFHWIYRLEKWKNQEGERLLQWFWALAELEALSSLANLAHNNPSWPFPELSDEQSLEMQAVGHPLILAEKRISNDLNMPTAGHIKLITGSNMAGKSTFLRTVGLNVVLAMSGSVVCAEKLRLPLLQVYTSMRTQDALHESTSSFFAELKRLKTVIEAVEARSNIFFLLDEILKGTNSRDRHSGAKALIEQLIRNGGAGLIATHDLELTALEADADGHIENLCMEVGIDSGQLHFDYKLKKGVTASFNASILMQQMGIEMK